MTMWFLRAILPYLNESSQKIMTLEAEMRTEFIRKYEGKERNCLCSTGWQDITKESYM
jgi:hypothetical protein